MRTSAEIEAAAALLRRHGKSLESGTPGWLRNAAVLDALLWAAGDEGTALVGFLDGLRDIEDHERYFLQCQEGPCPNP